MTMHMNPVPMFESMDVRMLRVLHALLTENSVSRAARRLNQSQPAVSVTLRRLRDLTGDQLLVRCRNGMTPTERGEALLEPVRIALEQIEAIAMNQAQFDPAQSRRTFNIGMPDYLSGRMVGQVVSHMHKTAPLAHLSFHSMSAELDFSAGLENGNLDLVVGNWPKPPEFLRIATLFEDEMVVMMRRDHPLAQREMTVEDYIEAEHIAPTPYTVGQRGVVDIFLAKERLKRNVVAWVPYFHMAPYMLVDTDLIFTAPRRFAEYQALNLPLTVIKPPLDFSSVSFSLLWHDRTHYSPEHRWFRNSIIEAMKSTH